MKVFVGPGSVQCLKCRSYVRFETIEPGKPFPEFVEGECPRCDIRFRFPLTVVDCEVVSTQQPNI